MATLRRATVQDTQALVDLRGWMHRAMGDEPTPEWERAAEAALRSRLEHSDFVAVLVEEAGVAVAAGVGWLEEHLPSPYQIDGRRGHVSSMSTHPDYRRRGLARMVLQGLMEWFAEHDVPRVDLRATPDGEPLYLAEGFRVLGGATMAWTQPGVRPGMPAGTSRRRQER